jgi:ectoine hydroxylase-related dioxygenase (phytanoyl-CoA dioxygenase family)
MDSSWLDHRLRPDELEAFHRDGYLIVENALDASERVALLDAIDGATEFAMKTHRVEPGDRFLLLDILGLDNRFYELIDHRATFPKIWDILGWNVQLYHTHLCVAPPLPGSAAGYRQHYLQAFDPDLSRVEAHASATAAWRWHRDSGQVNEDLGPLPHPRISVKVAYFLTDVSGANDGNLYVLRGSHADTAPRDLSRAHGRMLEDAVPVRVPAGAAVLFDRRIVHSASPNSGQNTRKVLFYGYSFRWFRPRDNFTVGQLADEPSSIRRQLLGWARGSYGYSSPAPEDVPLRQWLRDHGALVAGQRIAG